jgi:hypothetical protein
MKRLKNIGLGFSLLGTTVLVFYACYLCTKEVDKLQHCAQQLFFVYAAIFCGFFGIITLFSGFYHLSNRDKD